MRTLTPTETDVLLAYIWAFACINLGALFVSLGLNHLDTLILAPILTGSFIYGVQYLLQTHPIKPILYRP